MTYPEISTHDLELRKGMFRDKLVTSSLPPRRANTAHVFDIDGTVTAQLTPGEQRFGRGAKVCLVVVDIAPTNLDPIRIHLDAAGKTYQFTVDVHLTVRIADPEAYVRLRRPVVSALRSEIEDLSSRVKNRFERWQAAECEAALTDALEVLRTGRLPSLEQIGLVVERVRVEVLVDSTTRDELVVTREHAFAKDVIDARHELDHHDKSTAARLQRERDDAEIDRFVAMVRSGKLEAFEAIQNPERLAEIADKIRLAAETKRREDHEFLTQILDGNYASAAYPHVRQLLDQMFGAPGAADALTHGALIGSGASGELTSAGTDDDEL